MNSPVKLTIVANESDLATVTNPRQYDWVVVTVDGTVNTPAKQIFEYVNGVWIKLVDNDSGITKKTEIVATDSQTVFNLPTYIKDVIGMSINGADISPSAFSFTNNTLTYIPAVNGNKILLAIDKLILTYNN